MFVLVRAKNIFFSLMGICWSIAVAGLYVFFFWTAFRQELTQKADIPLMIIFVIAVAVFFTMGSGFYYRYRLYRNDIMKMAESRARGYIKSALRDMINKLGVLVGRKEAFLGVVLGVLNAGLSLDKANQIIEEEQPVDFGLKVCLELGFFETTEKNAKGEEITSPPIGRLTLLKDRRFEAQLLLWK
jgi:hypothetical protein